MNTPNVPAVIVELRRQAGLRNATWPCILLKNLMPACDAIDELIVCVDDMFAERAARGAKDVGTLVELRTALARFKGGAA